MKAVSFVLHFTLHNENACLHALMIMVIVIILFHIYCKIWILRSPPKLGTPWKVTPFPSPPFFLSVSHGQPLLRKLIPYVPALPFNLYLISIVCSNQVFILITKALHHVIAAYPVFLSGTPGHVARNDILY